MSLPDYAGAIAHALNRLREELPGGLTYHNLYHTEQDVMPAALRLAKCYRLDEDESHLLQVAAAYHDTGYIEAYTGHELASVRILTEVLPAYHFSSQQIERLVNLILATRLPQSPDNLLEEILVDADLDVLGREDFFERSEALRQELIGRGEPVAIRPWMEQQLGFLQGHIYFTKAARELRDAGKHKNIVLIEKRLHR
jgi:uncharacterized protein